MTARSDGLCIILPVYNEAGSLAPFLAQVSRRLSDVDAPGRIIIVDDGSTDASPAIAGEFAAGDPRFTIVQTGANAGYGAAIRRGIAAADREWVLIMDADGQIDPGYIPVFWERRTGCDAVIGFREKRKDRPYRIIMGCAGNLASHVFLGPLAARDINCGIKLFRTGDIKPLALISRGNSIYFEILLYLKRKRPAVAQIPVAHEPRRAGKATGGRAGTILRIIAESLRIVFRYYFTRP